jgi:F0F1-type ATP synthase assembly protein I
MTQTHKLSHGVSTTATAASVAPLSQANQSKSEKYATNPSGIVVGLTVNMGWQLAIVVLLPLFGGHVLDDHLNTSPWLTLTGLIIAMVAMILVVRRTLQELNEYTANHETPVDADKKGKA